VQTVHNGACVIVDDAGVGMDAHAVESAGRLLDGARAVDVTRLGDPPRFGSAVVGVLARRYGFSVSVDTRSPYGGVRAVALLPAALLTHLEPAAPEAPARPAPAPEDTPRPAVTEGTTEGGLPKRRRRTPRRQPAPEPEFFDTEEPPGRSPEENARIMGAFARGTRFGRAAGRILDDDIIAPEPSTPHDNEGTPRA
jgi:hypothetical protein